MNPSKKVRPAIAQTMNGPRGSDQLGSRISPSNTLSSSKPQAADDRGEDDWMFFRARPDAIIRTRFPLPGEFPDDFLEHGGAVPFVRVCIVRDDNGLPVWAARNVTFRSGGSA
jgi:hypothetical protein